MFQKWNLYGEGFIQYLVTKVSTKVWSNIEVMINNYMNLENQVDHTYQQ